LRSQTTRRFWRLFDDLPDHVQEHARRAYLQFTSDPAHPGLQFKRVSLSEPLHSARIGIHHRAVGLLEGDTITWIWIGSHDDYDRLLRS
jgi:hypothetical protein